MHYHVLVENQPGRGYIATVLGLPDSVGVGTTQEEAITNARANLENRLARGEIIRIEVGESSADPWERVIGQFVDDPRWDEFQDELNRLREEANRA